MKQEMRSIDLHILVKEMQFLQNAKVEKIFHNEDNSIIFHFHVTGKGKQFLNIHVPTTMYLSEEKAESPQQPSGFCRFLRKQLNQSRLRSLEQIGSERVIKLIFETKEKKFHVFIEYFSKGNVLFCDETNTIISLLQPQSWRGRTLRGGVTYEPPQKDINLFKSSLDQLSSLKIAQNLSKTLATELGIGGQYAEEMCQRAKLDEKKETMTKKDWENLSAALNTFLAQETKGIIIKKDKEIRDIIPYSLKKYQNYEKEIFKTLNEAFSHVFTTQAKQATKKKQNSKYDKQLAKVESIIDAQTKQAKKMQKTIDDCQKTGEWIYEHYQEVQTFLSQLKEARKKMSLKEIQKKSKKIKSIDEKNQSVEVEF